MSTVDLIRRLESMDANQRAFAAEDLAFIRAYQTAAPLVARRQTETARRVREGIVTEGCFTKERGGHAR